LEIAEVAESKDPEESAETRDAECWKRSAMKMTRRNEDK